MRVSTTANRATQAARRSGTRQSIADFGPFTAGDGEALAAAGGPAPLLGVDALLALQAQPAGETATEAALRHGSDLLRHLDDLHRDLIDGRPDTNTLDALRAALAEGFADSEDREVAALLRDIEVRAAVEIAKRERDGH